MGEIEIVEQIVEIIDVIKDEDGWVNLASLGDDMAKNNVDWKTPECFKLVDFFKGHRDSFEIRTDSDIYKMPVVYVRYKGQIMTSQKVRGIKNAQKGYENTPSLLNWAYMGNFRQNIENLAGMALKERWYYKENNPKFPNQILSSYLKYTFCRLYEEGKIMERGIYAAFNTGLVDKLYEPIYALFGKNRNEGTIQSWFLIDFCVSGTGKAGKNLARNFNPLPERAHYFKNLSELIYDINAAEPQMNWEHIILDNVRRFPDSFIEDNKPAGFETQNTAEMSEEAKKCIMKA